jgi:hypothetical protein
MRKKEGEKKKRDFENNSSMHWTCSSHVHIYDRSGKRKRVKGLIHIYIYDAMYIKQIGKNNLVFL